MKLITRLRPAAGHCTKHQVIAQPCAGNGATWQPAHVMSSTAELSKCRPRNHWNAHAQPFNERRQTQVMAVRQVLIDHWQRRRRLDLPQPQRDKTNVASQVHTVRTRIRPTQIAKARVIKICDVLPQHGFDAVAEHGESFRLPRPQCRRQQIHAVVRGAIEFIQGTESPIAIHDGRRQAFAPRSPRRLLQQFTGFYFKPRAQHRDVGVPRINAISRFAFNGVAQRSDNTRLDLRR